MDFRNMNESELTLVRADQSRLELSCVVPPELQKDLVPPRVSYTLNQNFISN